VTFFRALISALAASLVLTGTAFADVQVGVTDDLGFYTDQSTWFFDSLSDLGMQENRVAVPFEPDEPTTIQRQAALDSYLPLATLRGVRVVFSVAATKARTFGNPEAVRRYAEYLALLARTYPTVKDFIIGNEPNQPRFWQPQFGRSGQNVSAAGYFSVLGAAYDTLKAVDPSIRVIGLGLSPRGNDRPNAVENVSTSPVRFLASLGKIYRRSGRTKPIMDELAFHPYPDRDRDALMKGYRWPNAGVPNLGRLKQAVWDAFKGTGQPTFGEGRSRGNLALRLDELGWQVEVLPGLETSYLGQETVRPTDEASQARIYADAIRYLACDASVRSLYFFLLRDEVDLDRWQAGLVRVDGSRRPSFDTVKATVAETQGRCSGRLRSWRHSTTVARARVTFPKKRVLPARRLTLALVANAEEDARVEASLYRGNRRVLRHRASVSAYRSRIVRFSARFRPGRYTFRVTLRAALNPARSARFSATLRISG
jgi:hypothetical protein